MQEKQGVMTTRNI